MEILLIMFVDDLWRDWDGDGAIVLGLLDILLDQLWGLEVGGTAFQWFSFLFCGIQLV